MRRTFQILLALTLSALFLTSTSAQNLPNPRAADKLPPAAPDGSKLADWTSGPLTTLSARSGVLSVVSGGSDPIFYSGVLPPMRGPYFVEFRANSNLMGPLEIFWSTDADPKFNGQNKIAVGEAKAFDGKYRHYLIELPQSLVAPLHSLRIDPGTGSGEALFEFIRLRSMTGKIYQEWKDFN